MGAHQDELPMAEFSIYPAEAEENGDYPWELWERLHGLDLLCVDVLATLEPLRLDRLVRRYLSEVCRGRGQYAGYRVFHEGRLYLARRDEEGSSRG